MDLVITSQSATKLTVKWSSVIGVRKWYFLRDGVRLSNSTNPALRTATFSIPDSNKHTFTVQAVSLKNKIITQASVVVNKPIFPPPVVASGIGVLMYRGELGSCSHLDDDTYALAIASWKDPAFVKVKGEKYNYTIMKNTTGWDAPGQIVFDPSDITNWIDQVATLPPGDGVFIDNVIYGDNAPGGILAAIQYVSPILKSTGRKLCTNTAASITGDLRQNDGTLWSLWASQLVPYVDRIMMEHWQAYLNPSMREELRARGGAWYQQWDAYQKCVATCQGKFVGITYAGDAASGGKLDNAIYGRASLLLADGGGIFIYNSGNGEDTGYTDPYDSAWTMTNPVPVVDPVAVAASL